MSAVSIPLQGKRTRRLKLLLCALAAASIWGVCNPVPVHAADAVAGKGLALRWCASCHLVAEDQAAASSTSLPTFYDMAKDPGWTEAKLATFLADPHPQMPDMVLSNIEIANLAKYISSLAP